MALTERLALIVTANTSGAVQGLVNVGKAADKELGKAESRIDRVGGKLTKFGSGALLAGGIAAAGLYKAGQAASNLEQAVGGTESVFQEASKTIDKFAKSSAQSVGLSERAFRELSTVTGASLKGMGFDVEEAANKSVQLVTIGADLAATFGGTTNDAVAALGATLRGEFDPAEKFGIALTANAVAAKAVELGLADSTSSVSANAKAQATLALIVERSADAQGQFAREADGAAGSQQRLKAEFENFQAAIGEAVLPVMAKLAGAAGDVLGAFNGLSPATKSAVGEFAAFATGGLLVVGAVASLTGRIIKMRDAFRDAEGNTTRLGKAVGAVGGILAAAAIAKTLYDINTETNKLHINLEALNDDKQLASTVREIGKAMDGTDAVVKGMIGTFEDWVKASPAPEARRIRDEMERQGIATAGVDKIIQQKTRADANAAVAAEANAAAVDAEKAAMDAAAPAVVTLTRDLEAEAKALEDTRDKQRALADATFAAFDANLGYRESVRETNAALAEYSETTKNKKATADELQGAEDAVYRAYLDQAAAAAIAAGAVEGSTEATKIQKGELQNLANALAPGSPLRAQLQAYIDQLGALDGRQIQVEIRQRFSTYGLRAVAGDSSLERLAQVNAPGAAEGGLVRPRPGGTLVNVAEVGKPELIIPLDRFTGSGTGGSGGTTFNVTINAGMGTDATQVGRVFVEYVDRYLGSGGSSKTLVTKP